MERLDVRALALGMGTLWASYVLQLGWIAQFGWGTKLQEGLASLYVGYRPTFRGSLVGAAWGFLDGALAGAVIATVYKAVAARQPERLESTTARESVARERP